MSRIVYVLNGPNLNLLGRREPGIYGRDTLEDVEATCRALLPEGFALRMLQSNHEGEIVGWIQEARADGCGIVINAGAFTHTSIAILDALSAFEGPVIEVHISQVYRREAFRHHSYVSHRADGVIVGLGIEGYEAAVRRIVNLVTKAT